jgi:hypothetical protein
MSTWSDSSYPVRYEQDFVEKRSRLTTFFRGLLAFPHFFVLMLWGIAAWFGIVAAWFAIVFTGRYPAGLYAFVASFFRYVTRVGAYLYLATDAYPPFSGGEHPDYPVRLHVGPPLPEYNRLYTGLRFIFGIPMAFVSYVAGIVAGAIVVVSWFVIVITGRQLPVLQDLTWRCLSLMNRTAAYTTYLLTETWPSLDEIGQGQLQNTGGGPALPSA